MSDYTKAERLLRQYRYNFRLHRKALEAAADKEMCEKDIGVSHNRVIGFLYHNRDKNITQRDIASQMRITPAAVALIIKTLEEKGYIERRRDANDRRFNSITLTEKGSIAARKTEAVFHRVDSRMLEGLTDSEIEQMADFMERINRNLEEVLKEGPAK